MFLASSVSVKKNPGQKTRLLHLLYIWQVYVMLDHLRVLKTAAMLENRNYLLGHRKKLNVKQWVILPPHPGKFEIVWDILR